MADSCATCFFGRTAPSDDPFTGSLLCGRNAPTFQTGAYALWPVVSPDFWCGEFSVADPHVYGIVGPPGPAGPTGPQGPVGVAFNPVLITGLVASPASISSIPGQMLGLANVGTPLLTGRFFVEITGSLQQTQSLGNITYQIRAGTGTAPNNGVSLAGTAFGGPQQDVFVDTRTIMSFSISAIISGFALNVPIWVDLSVATPASGIAFLAQVNTIAFEF